MRRPDFSGRRFLLTLLQGFVNPPLTILLFLGAMETVS
jgi:hypothetical protein